MKMILVLLLALSFDAQAAESLRAIEKKTILDFISIRCLDTWCEGDYEFDFTSMTKLKHTDGYQVNFQIRSDENNPWYKTSCELEGRVRFEHYIVNKISGDNVVYVLSDEVYELMSECVNDAEAQASEKYPIEPSKSGTKEICVKKNCKKD